MHGGRLAIITAAAFATLAGSMLASAQAKPGASAAARKVYVPSRCTNERYKPPTIVIGCGDLSLFVNKIRYSVYNARRAKGRGTAYVDNCVPDCANATFKAYPAKISLYRPRFCKGKRKWQFTRLFFAYPAGKPAGGKRRFTTPFPCRTTTTTPPPSGATQACIGAPSDQPAARYSETRQFVDAQAWWTPTPGETGTNFGHAHVGACLPERESLSGPTFPLDIKLQLHNNPADPTSTVYPGLDIVVKGTDHETTIKEFHFLGWACPVGNCAKWVHYDVPLSAFGHAGLQEVRFRFLVDEADGNRMIANLDWQAYINNGKSISNVSRQPYLRGKGWYTGSGYCESSLQSVPIPDSPVAQPYAPVVAQVWHGTSTDLPVTGHVNRLDANFHDGIEGTTLADGPEPFGPAALSVPFMDPGVHKILGRADCADPRGSTNAGVLVYPIVAAG